MKHSLNIRQMIGGCIIRAGEMVLPPNYRNRGVAHQLFFSNPFVAQVIRNGRVVQTARGYNGVTIVGKNHMLDVTFGKGTPLTQVDPWYIGLINDSPSPVLLEADTLASHSGWTEWTSYTGNRKAWVDADAASKIKGTTTASSFIQSANGTLNGILVASVDTGTSGVLWATGSFDTTLDVITSDEVKVTYGVRL